MIDVNKARASNLQKFQPPLSKKCDRAPFPVEPKPSHSHLNHNHHTSQLKKPSHSAATTPAKAPATRRSTSAVGSGGGGNKTDPAAGPVGAPQKAPSFVAGLRGSLPSFQAAAKQRPAASRPSGHGHKAAAAPANSVRAANQQFFLSSEFKDPDFLRDECKLALAQVSPPPERADPPQETTHSGGGNIGVFCVVDDDDAGRLAEGDNNLAQDHGLLAESRSVYGRLARRADDKSNNNNSNQSPNGTAGAGRLNGKAATASAYLLGRGKAEAATAPPTTNGMRRNGGAALTHQGQPPAGASAAHQHHHHHQHHHSASGGSHQSHQHHQTTTHSIGRATAGNGSTVPTTIEIVFNPGKPLPKTPKTSHTNLLAGLQPAASSTAAKSTAPVGPSVGHQSRSTVKPLVHRHSYTSRVTVASSNNNNTTGSNGLGHQPSPNHHNHNNNPSMHPAAPAAPPHRSLDPEDEIKYIDSDDPPAPPAPQPPAKHAARCLPAPLVPLPATTAAEKSRVRPKSTIICSSSNNHNVFEKVTNYKFTNGSAESVSGPPRRQGGGGTIDSGSIKASIEKFNSLSEQKRLPLGPSAVIMRSTKGTGSTSNLQHHRHSGSDFDNSNLRVATNASSSLTRSPSRTVATAGGKVRASMLTTTTATVVSAARPINLLNHSAASAAAINTNSLPSKSSISSRHEVLLPALSRTATADRSLLGKAEAASSLPASTTTLSQFKGVQSNSNSSSSDAVAEDSVRSTTTGRSILPPPSPTSSRYWDRDSSRTASTSASANNSNLDHDLNKSDAKHEGLCGLRNIGNTCFMNSVIQCLSHTTELTKFLRSYNASRSGSSKDQAILCEFAKLIREMWTNNVNSVTPMELKRAFSTKHRMYSDYNQQDAQEFLRFFLDSLHGALNSGIKGEVLKIDDNLSDNKKAELNWEWYTRHENSLIRDLFVGQLKSTLRCTTCGNTSVTFDPFWDLSVSLPSSSRCKLEACLDLFIKEEVLDGDEMPTCSKCQTRRKCTKSFTIQRFPKYLVIHLKRFSETRWSKMSNIVEFPTGERELNMGPYGSNRNSMYYSLYAISNHMGSTAGGHYVALCKHPVSKRWHEFNDNIVSDSLSESQLVSSSAYILFYERV